MNFMICFRKLLFRILICSLPSFFSYTRFCKRYRAKDLTLIIRIGEDLDGIIEVKRTGDLVSSFIWCLKL